jgi:RNA-directed DNA polymerase
LGRGSESISDRVFATGSLRALIVLMTPGNAAQADPVEERGAPLLQDVLEKHGGALKPTSVSTKQEHIATLARSHPERAFFTLNQYIDYEWVHYAYACTRKDGAVGVDDQTAEEYAVNLEQNLRDLVVQLKSGRYRAPPVRRHYISKADGSKRGLGIPCFADKVAQRAIVMLLEPIYEQDFLDCSFGFRPERDAHQALQVVRRAIMEQSGRWILDVDVRKYFDSIDRTKLRQFFDRRVTDGVVRRLIDKWLTAGVLEDGQVHHPDTGTPQGGVISPCLANVFLHYVLDEWFAEQVQPRLRGPSTLVRFADDFVALFANREDAERVLEVLAKRLGKYGLQLHPDKTQMVDFRRTTKKPSTESGKVMLATTFKFLGFLHVWGKSRKGNTVVRQQTAKERVARALKAINEKCRRMRHEPLPEQHRQLSQMLKGHFAYFGISGNYRRLADLRFAARRIWRTWLSRRSTKSHVAWEVFAQLEERYPLPQARIVHGYTAL